MAEQKYYVDAVWTDPDDWARILFRKYDNDGIGYTRLEAMRICVRLTGEGKYCSVKKFGKEVKKCAAKSIRKSDKQTLS